MYSLIVTAKMNGVDPQAWPLVSIILMLSGISRFMLIEEEFGFDVGHAETVELITRHIRALEGERVASTAVPVGTHN